MANVELRGNFLNYGEMELTKGGDMGKPIEIRTMILVGEPLPLTMMKFLTRVGRDSAQDLIRSISHPLVVPFWELTYPILGKGILFSKVPLKRDMLVPWRV